MIQFILRGLFLLMAAVVAALYAVTTFGKPGDELKILATMAVPLFVAGTLILIDVLTPRKKLSAVSGVFLGLIVGMLAAYAMSFLVTYVGILFPAVPSELLQGIQVFLGVICVFGAVSLILQTKDDFRFIIPYVEFTKQIRGPRPMILDTSAVIDGRILDIAQTQILTGLLIVPRFVLNELQTISDSADKLKRARGRRGLDILTKLQNHPLIDVSIEDAQVDGATVDQMLITLSDDLHARLLTTDFNLAKIAEVRGVDVININKLAEALRPVLLPGEELNVQLIKPGESPTQGVGYLEDGTMIVVEHGRPHLGSVVPITVTSVLQTSAGRMIFGRLKN
ncbi:MAG: TRAM domain-containing protein [Phycisphaeraceae bacterium]